MKLHMKSSVIALALGLAVSGGAFATEPTPPPVPQGVEQHDLKAGQHPEGAKPGREHGDRGDRGHPGKRGGGLEAQLDLNKDQSKALRESMRNDVSEQRAIVGSYLKKLPKPEQDAMAADLKASHDKHFKAFLDTLTPEQQVKAKEIFSKFKEGHHKDKPGAKATTGDVPPSPPVK